VVINYTKSERETRETVTSCEDKGVLALLCRADVCEEDDCRRTVAEALDMRGRIHIRVNNAATTKFCDQHDLEGLHKDDFLQIFSVNVVGPYQMVRFVVPHMKKAGSGAIVNVASYSGITGIGSSTAYAASKGALITMTLSLARVLGPEIRVNAVCPGLTQTRWNKLGLGEERYEALKSFCEDSSPLHLIPTPEDVADVILYLIEGARSITGETLIVDGGNTSTKCLYLFGDLHFKLSENQQLDFKSAKSCYFRSLSSMRTLSGASMYATRSPGRTCRGSTTNLTPFALSSA